MPRVLVLDDDTKQGRLMAVTLTEAGYDVTYLNEGLQALSAHRAQPMDLVITDLVMPGMNGVEFLGELRKDSPTLPVIVMTAGGLRIAGDNLEMISALGVSATLVKPFGREELLSAVREALQS